MPAADHVDRQMLAALDSSRHAHDEDEDDRRCHAIGPRGEQCARHYAHPETENILGADTDHYSWETGHYTRWPAGWRSAEEILEVIEDMTSDTAISPKLPDPAWQAGYAKAMENVSEIISMNKLQRR